jgi:hypothetical protein
MNHTSRKKVIDFEPNVLEYQEKSGDRRNKNRCIKNMRKSMKITNYLFLKTRKRRKRRL